MSMMVAGSSVTEVVVAEKMQTTLNREMAMTSRNSGQSKYRNISRLKRRVRR